MEHQEYANVWDALTDSPEEFGEYDHAVKPSHRPATEGQKLGGHAGRGRAAPWRDAAPAERSSARARSTNSASIS